MQTRSTTQSAGDAKQHQLIMKTKRSDRPTTRSFQQHRLRQTFKALKLEEKGIQTTKAHYLGVHFVQNNEKNLICKAKKACD